MDNDDCFIHTLSNYGRQTGAEVVTYRAGVPHELILVDLHNALRSLDTLTGSTTTDDILARIFATFCIGK